MSLWWLTASEAELKAARTCRNCGCGDADIDLGLCFDCFSQQRGPDYSAEYEAYCAEQYQAYCEEMKQQENQL